jgi:hypothetical protein
LARGLQPTVKSIELVSKSSSPLDARWAFTQWKLRAKAKPKFELADEMLFENEALEMLTHPRVAQFHAQLFVPGSRIWDITAGLGSDLIELTRRHQTVGYEVDAVRAAYCSWNLRAHSLEAQVQNESALNR